MREWSPCQQYPYVQKTTKIYKTMLDKSVHTACILNISRSRELIVDFFSKFQVQSSFNPGLGHVTRPNLD